MTLTTPTNYEATIPTQANGTVVSYYIEAIDAANKVENHPYIGAPDPHVFTAECITGIESKPEPSTYFSTYPNPSNGDFFAYMDSKRNCSASIKIGNVLGQEVYHQTFDLVSGISLSHINIEGVNKGIYFIEFKTDQETITKQIVIK